MDYLLSYKWHVIGCPHEGRASLTFTKKISDVKTVFRVIETCGLQSCSICGIWDHESQNDRCTQLGAARYSYETAEWAECKYR